MGFTMMPALSAAYVTLRPQAIARATSVANVVQRVASGFGVAVMATILSNRIVAHLPPLPHGGASAHWLPLRPAATPCAEAGRGQGRTEGIIVGAAAGRIRDGRPDGLTHRMDPASTSTAYQTLAELATRRLRTGSMLYRAGTSASGLVPQPGLSARRRFAVGLFGVAAVVGMVLALVHAHQPPTVRVFPGA